MTEPGQANVTACPWHAFWEHVASKGLSPQTLQDHGRALRATAAANPLAATAAAGIAAPLLLALVTVKGRRVVLATLDTSLATVLLICLLGVVLGLPVGAFYLLWVAGGYLVRFLTSAAGLSA